MTLMRDTTTAARRVQIEALRRLDGPTRVRMACQMSDDSREVTLAGIRYRHPDWTDTAIHHELVRLMLGRDLATTVLERQRLIRERATAGSIKEVPCATASGYRWASGYVAPART